MRDFGGIVERSPARVILPASADEVVEAVREAISLGLEAVPRGLGHSAYGQSQTDGVSIDLRGLAGIHAIEPGQTVVDAGTTWREILDATLPHGLAPPVLTDHLDMTVGGTISAGGIGGSSHLYGTQADNVLALQVIASGGLVDCSAAVRPGLFDAVRGGLGRHGVITRATLRLVPVPERVLACTIPCRDAAGLLRLQREIGAEHISGQAKLCDDSGGGRRFEVKAVLHAGEPPAGTTETEEMSFLDFADRLRPDVEELIALGEWARPHPWGMVFLPGVRAVPVIEATLAETTRRELGLSGIVLIKALRSGGRLAGAGLPADPVLFGLLRTASPGCAPVTGMLAANRVLHDRARAVGGTRYAVDATG